MSQQAGLLARFPALSRFGQLPKPVLMGIAAAVVALLVVAALWSRGPEYRVLFSNLEDRDGGAIVTSLTQMNIPYKFSDNGGAILIPADKVHATRLQLAEQGLPRGGQVGFELFDNTRFGASQFSEQVTYQRSLEGELGSSIEALHSVQKARVHLAIPRETLFVRERKAPTASVLLTLYSGRALSQNQVAAITWLVSSSVPGLAAESVSVVDQNGRLLTSPTGEANADNQHRSFTHDVEQRAVERIMTLLTPLVGSGNVRAQVSADIDFSRREQTQEVYRPNQNPGEAAIRSQQTSSSVQNGDGVAQGIPGALTNQPPPNPVAPIVTPPQGQPEQPAAPGAAQPQQAPAAQPQAATSSLQTGGANASSTTGATSRHDSTVNYEVDRTISHIKDPMGRVRRLSVAVVVNYRPSDDGELQPLADTEMQKIQDLARQAMGFDVERGDTLSVINSPFNDGVQAVPVWKDPEAHAMASEVGKWLLILIALFIVWRKIVKPIIDSTMASRIVPPPVADRDQEAKRQEQALAQQRASEISRYEDNLNTARDLAKKDPRAVAMVLRTWMEKNANR